MRNELTKPAKPAKLATITALILWVSSASAFGAYYYLNQDSTNIIKCVPQPPVEKQLWTCSDYYGNIFKDLVIIKNTQNTQNTRSTKGE